MPEKYFLDRTQKETSEITGLERYPVVDLGRLRQYRGDDSAVIEITSAAEQKEFLSVLKNPENKSRNILMQEMFRNFSGKAYGDYQWSKYTGGWTTPKVPTLYGEFRSFCEKYDQLSLDAGFITHLPEFFEFIKEREQNKLDYLATRNEFKEKLGYKIVWRGMMLTEKDLQDIRNNGIPSSFTEYIRKTDNPKEEFEAKILSTYIHELIERHFHGENPNTPFISVSAEKNVAISVGRHFGKKSDGRKFYLLKIKVPEIDLIYYAEHGIKKPYKLQELKSKLSVSVDGDESEHEWDKNAESYLFWKIDPEEILEITQPAVSESVWNNRRTIG